MRPRCKVRIEWSPEFAYAIGLIATDGCLYNDGRHINFTSIGITTRKSKTIGPVKIPKEYFFDFFRGSADGDGTFHSYFDPRWRSSYMFYTIFISASRDHIDWLRGEIHGRLAINGHITKSRSNSIYQLKYAKSESLKLLPKLYYNADVVCLSRKREKITSALAIERTSLAN
jgi:hypothetical protein